MKYRIIKSIAIIVLVLLVALIFNAILFWGIIFDCDGGFESSTTHDVFKDIFTQIHATRMTLGEDPGNPIIGIPSVFWVYGIEPPPYVISLTIQDTSESFEKIFIESITIKYVDGQNIEYNVDWEREFESTPVFTSGNTGLVRIPAMGFSEKLPVKVGRRESCNISFVGYFVKKGGEKIPFDTTEYFEYEPKKWRIYPARGSF